MPARPGPLHVLDLACGSGRVRVAVARRVSAREIRYTAVDRSRHSVSRLETLLAAPASDAHSSPGDADHAATTSLDARLRARFIDAVLELNDPLALRQQLQQLVGGERFHEIHVHLLHPAKHGCQPTGPAVLRVVAAYLRPRGRIYHLFQNSSPFFDFRPEYIRPAFDERCPPPGSRGDVIGRDEQRFRDGAARAGLLLDKCGHRFKASLRRDEAAASTLENWVTRRYGGPGPDRRTAERYQRLAEQYSDYSRYATHFVILRKPAPRRRVSGGPSAADGV